MSKGESVILCEGYHDRAFWTGMLLKLGCTDPGQPLPNQSRRKSVVDPWGKEVRRGQYGFHSKTGAFIRIIPCHGKNNILQFLDIRLEERATKPLRYLVVSADADLDISSGSNKPKGPSDEAVERVVREHDPSATKIPDAEWLLADAQSRITVVRWQTEDGELEGLPAKQTLERLVCAALAEVYPSRAPAVQNWLDSRPENPAMGPKEYVWSYMAGWYADGGCEYFYRRIWDNLRVVQALESRLIYGGAWQVAQRLAEWSVNRGL